VPPLVGDPFWKLLSLLVVSGCLGALIGLERQYVKQGQGMRTFTLWALLGCLSAYVSAATTPWFFAVSFLVTALLISTQYIMEARPTQGGKGITTECATLLTFIIGGMVYWRATTIAVIVTVSMVLLLKSKKTIHTMVDRFTEKDVHSALQFAVITGIIMPLVPNHDYGPYLAFNPFKIWLMVVLVVGLGFAGYIAIRLFGAKMGIGLAGLLGGVASSTVTTIAFSRKSKEQPDLSRHFAIAVIIACTVMLVRVGILVLTINIDLIQKLWLCLLVLASPGLLFIGLHLFRERQRNLQSDSPEISNPLTLTTALKFAALYALIIFFTKAAQDYFGGSGLYAVSFLSGMTDMDAIAITLSQMAHTGTDQTVCARGILIAALSNTFFKACFAMSVGSPELRRIIFLTLGVTLLTGIPAWFLIG